MSSKPQNPYVMSGGTLIALEANEIIMYPITMERTKSFGLSISTDMPTSI